MAVKQISMKTKDAGDMPDMNPTDIQPPPPAPEIEEEPEEKYSAQVLRRLHEDALYLLQEYDAMREHLEHPEIDGHVQSKLENLVDEIEEIEGLMGEHHPDAAPLEGNKDMTEDEVGEDDQDTAADSEPEENPPSGEEAVEAMGMKRLTAHEMKSLRNHYKKSMCPKCGEDPCTCSGKKALEMELGVEGSHVPGDEADKQEANSGKKPEGKKRLKKDLGIEGSHEPGEEAPDEERAEGREVGKKAFDEMKDKDDDVDVTEPKGPTKYKPNTEPAQMFGKKDLEDIAKENKETRRRIKELTKRAMALASSL